MYKFSLSFFFSFFLLFSLYAQKGKGISIESSFHWGKIIRHTPKLTIQIPANSFGTDLSISFQTYGKSSWHQLQNYPRWGVTLLYYHLGNTQLGDAYGVFPNLHLSILNKKRLQIELIGGIGIAYLSQSYDALSNPKNNAIGSKLNNVTAFKLNFLFRLSPNWSFTTAGSFTHFSNGAIKLPNLGINVAALNWGIKYSLNPVQSEEYLRYAISKKAIKRFGLSIHFDLALREFISYGGPKYPIYIGSIAAVYHFNKVNHLLLGIEYEFNKAVYNFGLHTFDFDSEATARRGATRWMIFLADEFLMGNFGILLQAGIYISKSSFLIPFPIYNKIGIRYYFPPIEKLKTQFYLSSSLKSHKINAAYIAFGIGARF